MRKIQVERKTKETEIVLSLDLNGSGRIQVDTGVGFFDHMLTLFAFHAGFDLKLNAKGDLKVDDHHTVEDIGILLGQAFQQLLAKKSGMNRYGFFILPMDEVLARAVIDLSGRAAFRYRAQFNREKLGELASENIEEFFRAFVREAGCALHLEILTPGNEHHQAEALFKCFGRALKDAVKLSPCGDIPSTKGIMD